MTFSTGCQRHVLYWASRFVFRASLVPAAAVIPAPIAYIKVVEARQRGGWEFIVLPNQFQGSTKTFHTLFITPVLKRYQRV